MKIESNIESNSISLDFDKVEPLNIYILFDIEKYFKKLNNNILLNVNISEYAPIEALRYIYEVSQYCDMIITIEDSNSYDYLNELKKEILSSVKIKLKESNGS